MSRATFARALWSSGVERHQRELDLLERLIALYRDELAQAIDAADAEHNGLFRAGVIFSECLGTLKITVLPSGKVSVGG